MGLRVVSQSTSCVQAFGRNTKGHTLQGVNSKRRVLEQLNQHSLRRLKEIQKGIFSEQHCGRWYKMEPQGTPCRVQDRYQQTAVTAAVDAPLMAVG